MSYHHSLINQIKYSNLDLCIVIRCYKLSACVIFRNCPSERPTTADSNDPDMVRMLESIQNENQEFVTPIEVEETTAMDSDEIIDVEDVGEDLQNDFPCMLRDQPESNRSVFSYFSQRSHKYYIMPFCVLTPFPFNAFLVYL